MSAAPSPSYPAPIPQNELDRLFPLPRPAALKPKAYEFALVLAGTVSAGAYTAGVLDFLMEALDAWTRAKQNRDPAAPTHDAILSTIAGASGGAINGAILTRIAGFAFPHGPVAGNPFYDIWVNGPTLTDLLAPDRTPNGLRSLFNTDTFVTLATDLVKKTAPSLGSDGKTPVARAYLADPLRLYMMVANVTGVPYRINFQGESGLGHDMVCHADYTRFALTVPGGTVNNRLDRPDEFPLSSASPVNWSLVSDSALCTSAFPAAFPSRPLSRALEVLGYRVAVVPGENPGTAEIAQLYPRWDALEGGVTGGQIRTVNVDGGTLNNEPLDFARTALAGFNGRNPRSGDKADRGVIMVDPFSDAEDITTFDPPGFLKLLGPLVSTLVQQSRFKPEDIALATNYDTYSRFLIAPFGPGGGVTEVPGSSVIAAGGLGGFLGFLDRSFLDYDFRLGRYNAYRFLTEEFVLPSSNPIFEDTWSEDQMNAYKVAETQPGPGRPQYYLPIIPVMASIAAPERAAWPRLKVVPGDLGDRIVKRLDSVYAALKSDLQASKTWPGGVAAFAINQAYSLFLRGTLRDKVLATFTQALNDQNLLPEFTQVFPNTVAGKSSATAARAEWLAAGAISSAITETKTDIQLVTVWGN